MNESEIQNQLRVQKGYVNDAKRFADSGYTQRSVQSLVEARRCQNKISSMLLGIEKERGLVELTPELVQRRMKACDNNYAQETMKIFREGLDYCARRLGEAEFRRMMN